MRQIGADSLGTTRQAILTGGEMGNGRGLGLTVADKDFRTVQILHHPRHQ